MMDFGDPKTVGPIIGIVIFLVIFGFRMTQARQQRPLKLEWMPTLMGDKQMVLPTDTVMYQAQEVAAAAMPPDFSRIGHGTKGGIVSGDHGDLFTPAVHFQQTGQTDGLTGRHGRCGWQCAVGRCRS